MLCDIITAIVVVLNKSTFVFLTRRQDDARVPEVLCRGVPGPGPQSGPPCTGGGEGGGGGGGGRSVAKDGQLTHY